ncbi:phage major capsid protein [Streptomyces sp. NPDC048696]|uniref:phage major capsid protein n=1 Tax=Streptomyces sp. NPDC048696 TaxID=3365585 RepID=UPI00371A0836
MPTLLERALDTRARTWSQMQEITERAERDGRDLSAEERAAWDAAEAELTAASEDVERLERMARLAAVDRTEIVVTGEQDERADEQAQAAAYRGAFKAWARRGMSALSDEHRSLMMANEEEIRAGATSPNTAGGFLIPTELLATMTEAMKAYGGLLGLANVITTASGNPLNWPTSDETASVGAILAENQPITEQDVAFGQKSIGAYMYTSKLVRLSLQLLQDSAFDLETWLPKKLGERIGRAVAAHLTTGTGTGQPEGLFTNAVVGKAGAAGQVNSITYDDLIDLIHSVDPAYRDISRFVMGDQALKMIRKLKDAQGRPLWEPSVQSGVPSTLLGYAVTVDNGIPAPAASAKSVGFGDVNAAYVVRQVAGGQMLRLAERYAEMLQVGFFGFLRLDAKPDDAAAFRVYAHPAS